MYTYRGYNFGDTWDSWGWETGFFDNIYENCSDDNEFDELYMQYWDLIEKGFSSGGGIYWLASSFAAPDIYGPTWGLMCADSDGIGGTALQCYSSERYPPFRFW